MIFSRRPMRQSITESKKKMRRLTESWRQSGGVIGSPFAVHSSLEWLLEAGFIFLKAIAAGRLARLMAISIAD